MKLSLINFVLNRETSCFSERPAAEIGLLNYEYFGFHR